MAVNLHLTSLSTAQLHLQRTMQGKQILCAENLSTSSDVEAI